MKHVIYFGNVVEVLPQLATNSVDVCVTSPPYWGGLRRWGPDANLIWDGEDGCDHSWSSQIISKGTRGGRNQNKKTDDPLGPTNVSVGDVASCFCEKCGAWYGQLGLEPTLQLYIKHLLIITEQLQRIIKPDGLLFWNHGDNYGGSWRGGGGKDSYKGSDKKFDLSLRGVGRPKSMMLQNERFIAAMLDNQTKWRLRNRIIWRKTNPKPSSAKDRFSNVYEPMYMLSQQRHYYSNLEVLKVPWKDERPADIRRAIERREGYEGKYQEGYSQVSPDISGGPGLKGQPVGDPRKGKNPGDVWDIATQHFNGQHSATFPEELVKRCIQFGCRKGGVVLDPFLGSGTTSVVAERLNLRSIGIEVDTGCKPLIQSRFRQLIGPLDDVLKMTELEFIEQEK